MATAPSHHPIPAAVLAAALVLGGLPGSGAAQGAPGSGFTPGGRTIFDLNLAAQPQGQLPPQIKLLKGGLTMAMKDGLPMLKAPDVSEFLVSLPEFLPDDFTVEFELVPKGCCNPEDLAFEGTRAINQGNASARIAWDSDGYLGVTGGGETYESPMPEDMKTTLPGVLTQVSVSFEKGTIKLYTNGKRLYTLTDRRFVRGKVFRVFLGGQDDAAQAVHLAKLRIATNSPPAPGFVAGSFVPGKRTLFDLNLPAESLGSFPKRLRALKGSMAVAMKDGAKMLKASNTSEFLIPLPQVLPQDFTLDFDLVPKECCNPQDLSFEGTPAIDQGPTSAHILWDSDGYLAIIGGGDGYESPVPADLQLITPSTLTRVAVSFEGLTIKLYTNGRRLYTMSDRRFVRGKVLRVFLGGQDDANQSVHLARLRIATNSPAVP